MIESPLIQELVEEAEARGKAVGRTEGKAEGKHEAILTFLRARFGVVPDELAEAVTAIREERVLDTLLTHAARCRNLTSFRTRIPS